MKKTIVAALLAVSTLTPAQAGIIFEQSGRMEPYFDILLSANQVTPIGVGSYEVKVQFDKDIAAFAGGTMWVLYSYQVICPDPDPRACGRNNGLRVTSFQRVGNRQLVGRFDVLPIRSDERLLYYRNDEFQRIEVNAYPADGNLDSGMGYRLTISDLAAVPEPASWAMMIAGFGLAGTAARRRASIRTAVA